MATTSLQAAYDQARSYLEANKVEQAIGVAQHILEQFPENLEAHRTLGEAYLASRMFDQAEAAFSRVLHSDPENIPAHVGLGITYERQGKLDRAVTEFEQALEVRPDMPELRSQLLRLYTDAWGNEAATLRLSRPGLARLYAKGHMLPQAIQEFRSVIDELPDRFDARVGLAEALWRDGQEDAAAEICAEILAERSDVLKANLLLGYIRYNAGDESGETYWRLAQQLDPYQNVARALFESLPDIPGPDLTMPAWDEASWTERRSHDEAERRSQEQVPAAATGAGVAATGAGVAASSDDDFFSGWMNEVQAAQPAAPAPSSGPADDDFLANLLAFEPLSPESSGGVDLDSSSGITPFSFDELDPSDRRGAEAAPAQLELSQVDLTDADAALVDTPGAHAPADALAPLSLADLGLSEDDLAQPAPGQPAAQPAANLEEEFAPFSLADLGLTQDEIAELSGDQPATPASSSAEPAPAPRPPAVDEPALTPFSFEDLGLSAEEASFFDATPEAAPAPRPPAADEPALTPFSFEDLGLSAEEASFFDATPEAAPAPRPPAADEPALTPFSFEDLGLSPDEIAALEGTSSGATPLIPPPGALPPGRAAAPPASSLEDEPFMAPFSLDELDLSARPAARPPQPATDTSLSGLEPFDWAAGEDGEGPAAPDSGIDADMLAELQPFSFDDLDLNATSEDSGATTGSLPQSLQAFSLDDAPLPQNAGLTSLPPLEGDEQSESGGYSWQQPSSKKSTDFLRREQQAEQPSSSIFSKLRQRAQDRPKEEEEPLPPVSLSDVEAAAYFSSDDIPLREEDGSPERITGTFRLPREEADATPAPGPTKRRASRDTTTPANSLPAVNSAMPTPEPGLTPFSFEELGLSPAEIAALARSGSHLPPATPAPAAAEEELTPFSFADLGLSPEETAALENAESEAASAPTADEPALTPFSFEELGLSPDEIAALEGAGSGAAPAPAAPASDEPALTPFSFEELGLSPDEMSFFDATPETTPAPRPPTSDEPALTPFSFEELGLSPDEIAALAGTPSGTAPASDEPALTPFSFEELGLSPEEIAALAGTPSGTAPASDEPALTPFSFAELGLSPEEIAALDAAAATGDTIVPGWSKGQEPALTPFDLTESASGPTAAEQEATDGLTPFSFDDFDFGEPSATQTAGGSAQFDEPFDSDVQPFSMDDLGLGDLDNDPNRSRELDITDEELAGLDLGNLETVLSDAASLAAASIDEVITGDPALDKLINLGRRQGYVDLTDIIAVVEDPEAEAERIEEIGWTLHRAGIQIRDGDEIIDMEEVEPEEVTSAPTPAPAPISMEEPDLTPFSFADLGLSADEIAALGLTDADMAEPAAPTPSPTAPRQPAPPAAAMAEEPELTPFSFEELGLSPDEIAALAGTPSGTAPAAPATDEPELTPFSFEELGLSPDEIAALAGTPSGTAPAAPAAEEPELTPFSFEELGLSPDEIAALTGTPSGTAPAAPATDEPELTPFSFEELGLSPDEIAALAGTPSGTAPAAPATEEPELTPFSFEELGLSPDEIAALETAGSEAAAAGNAPGSEDPTLTPFSLEDLGLSPDEIAALQSAGSEATPATTSAEEDFFDFGMAEEQVVERVTKRTTPREEAPPPPAAPEDTAFTPAPLDSLDDIWNIATTGAAAGAAAAPTPPPAPSTPTPPARSTSPEPARVVLPPLSERPRGRSETPRRESAPPPTRDDARFARREAARTRDDRNTRREPVPPARGARTAPEPAQRTSAPRSLAGFIPSGDEALDNYLHQMDAEPANYGLALAVARLAAQTGRADLMALVYKRVLRGNDYVAQATEEIEELIENVDDQAIQRQLYRVLGDAYSKQGRLREAVDAYGHTFAR